VTGAQAQRRGECSLNETGNRVALLSGAIAAVAVVLLLVPLAGSASANGVYRAFQCHPWYGGGDYASARLYGGFWHYENCSWSGTGLTIGLPPDGAGYGTNGGWAFDAPQGTYFSRVNFEGWRYSHNGWVGRFIAWYPDGNWLDFGGPEGQWHRYGASGPFTSVTTELVCVWEACWGSLSAAVNIWGLDAQLTDTSPPSVGASGSLLAEGVRRGVQELKIAASDQGGGLAAAYALVNGVRAASHGFPCATDGYIAHRLQPCPSDGSPTLNLDTQTYPFHDGPNNVQVCAADFANESSPNLSCWPPTPRVVEVDNSCEASPVPGGTQLSARFLEKNDDDGKIKVTSKRGATVVGRLTDDEGKGIADATLCVKERTLLEGAGAWDVGTVKTDDEGRYKYGITRGPNREVTIAYRVGSEQIASPVEFYSRAKPRLKLSDRRVKNGSSIRLFGELPGPESGGRVVVFQAAGAGGSRWYTFRKAETDEDGRFEAHYRFRNTTRTTTYRMRVVVPDQNGYPYLSGKSEKRRVTVTG
jgi:hypothetical protein